MQIKSQVHRQVKINKVKCAEMAKYDSTKMAGQMVSTEDKQKKME